MDKKQLLTEIAKAYYVENRTQIEIAKLVGVNRSQISRYLKEAQEEGIVKIQIVEPDTNFDFLEREIKTIFPHLEDVIIAPVIKKEIGKIRENIGRRAAAYLSDIIIPGQTIVLGCGRTLSAMAKSLKPHSLQEVTVVQAMGNLGHEAHGVDYNKITQLVADAFGARPYFISAPAILGRGSGSARDLIKANSTIHHVLDRSNAGDIYMVGIGSISSDQLYVKVGMVQKDELEKLKDVAVGDIIGRFFDLNGVLHKAGFEERIIGAELSSLKKAKKAIGVACGKDKVAPIIGALKGKWINTLISDEETIREVILQAKSPSEKKIR